MIVFKSFAKEKALSKLIRNLIDRTNISFGGPRGKPDECLGRMWFSSEKNSNIVNSPLGDVTVPKILFHELIFQDWSLWEKKTAILCGATGRKYTYKNLKLHSKSLAAAFQNKFRLKKGDYVAVILPNCPEYPIIILASSMCGVVVTTVNPVYTIDEIKTQLTDCKAKLLVTDHKNYQKCVELSSRMELKLPIVVLKTANDATVPEGGIDLLEIFNSSSSDGFNQIPIDLDDVMVLPYSSGTTGSPKGVILTHRNVVSNLVQISHPETCIIKPTTRFHQDTMLAILPMFHIYGLMIATFNALKDGCRLVVLPRFDPRLYIKNLVAKKINILYVVPPLMKFLSHEKVSAKYLSKLEFLINGAAPMSESSAYKILEKAPHVKIAQGYGMTESSPVLAHTSNKRMQKLTAIGIPIASTRFKIISIETGETLPAGKEGELCAWGPQVMRGYLNRPEDTKRAFDNEGWLRTGDIAYYDKEGDFFVIDRLKSLIKVAPAELEEVISEHPKIKEVAVVGIKNEEFGEVPRAFVVLEKGAHLTEEEVKEIIAKRMSSYKHLKGGVRFVNELPKNAAGKIVRKNLADGN